MKRPLADISCSDECQAKDFKCGNIVFPCSPFLFMRLAFSVVYLQVYCSEGSYGIKYQFNPLSILFLYLFCIC